MARALPCWFLIAAFLPIAAGADANHPMPQLTPDARVSAMVAGVDSTRLSQSVDTLVNFGTRNDFSENASTATHGVFGARDWIAAQFRAIAAGTGGRMTVALDTYLQPKTKRCTLAIGANDSLLRSTELPLLPLAEMRQMLKFNSKNYLQQDLRDQQRRLREH